MKRVRTDLRMPWGRSFLWTVQERQLPWRELAQFTEVHKIVPPSFKMAMYEDAEGIEGEEVLTLRPEERVWGKWRGERH